MNRLRGLLRMASGGVTDAALASLATFAVGLAAARLLDPTDLGVYAIYFTAFLTGMQIPLAGIFAPAEVVSVSHPVGQRVRVLRQSLRAGRSATLASAVTMLAATAASWSITSPETTLAFTATGIVAAYLSPIQDHVRRVLIKDDVPWSAALISLVQVVTIIVAIAGMSLAPINGAWVPFGSLAAANLVSLAFAVVLMRLSHLEPLPQPMTLRSLSASGRYLLASQVVPTAAAFLAATIISRLAGAAELGYAEAARIASQPVLVAALGIQAVFEPRLMEAAGRRKLASARRNLRTFYGLLAVLGVLYLLVGGWSWSLNPMAYLMEDAYVVPGLVAVYVLANLANGMTYAGWAELAGGGHENPLARASSTASAAWLVAAATAGVTGAFARPIGLLLQSLARHGLYWRHKRHMYTTPPTIVDERDLEVARR